MIESLELPTCMHLRPKFFKKHDSAIHLIAFPSYVTASVELTRVPAQRADQTFGSLVRRRLAYSSFDLQQSAQ